MYTYIYIYIYIYIYVHALFGPPPGAPSDGVEALLQLGLQLLRPRSGAIIYYMILYYTILYYTIPYHTIL